MIRNRIVLLLPLVVLLTLTLTDRVRAQESEPEFVIVKYGKLFVKSSLPGAKVYVDDVYKGAADAIIENILVGEHVITCRSEAKSATGTFQIKKDSLLKLETHYKEGKLAPVIENEKAEKAESQEKAENEKKIKKTEAPRPQPKKAVAEVKKEEKRSPAEERRATYMNVIKVFFDDLESDHVRISYKANPRVVSRYQEKKDRIGKYYRTKSDMLLCDKGPCEQQWSSSFVYGDEQGNNDTFSLTWKQVVFNGMTPAGTSKRDLLFCLNGICQTLKDETLENVAMTADNGRYNATWRKTSLVIRRIDIMKEIIDAGGSVEAY